MLFNEKGRIRTFSAFNGFNIDPKDFTGYDVDLYNIMVVGQVREPWRMSSDYKHIIIRMTKPGQIDRYRDRAGVCVAMLQVDHERTSRKHNTTRMDDKGPWVYVCELLKLLAAQLEACIAEGKETAIFFKEDPEDTYSCYTVLPLIRITREEFFADDVDPGSGAPAANLYRKDKAFFLRGDHVEDEPLTLQTLKASPPEYKKQLTQRELDAMELPASGTVMEDMRMLFMDMPLIEHLRMHEFRLKNGKNMNGMFSGCRGLRKLDLTGLDTSSVTDMGHMFYGCEALKALDLTGLDTSSVTDMTHMFYGCEALKALDLTGFDTSRVKYMNGMFGGCASLEVLDLSGFDFSRVTYMRYMFSKCDSLREVIFSETVHKSCQGKIKRATGRMREAETWNPLDAHTRQQAEIQGIIYKSMAPQYVYYSLFGLPEEERRDYLGLSPDVKITIVPHGSGRKQGGR